MNTPSAPALPHPTAMTSTLDGFLRALLGKNRSDATITAYRADIRQFLDWLVDNNGVANHPSQIERADINEYLAHLASLKLTGVTRARKLAALREWFRFLEGTGSIMKVPTLGVDTPKVEQNSRTHLRPDEYSRLLALAGANARDFAILTVFLQTGIRVSELCTLTLADIELLATPKTLAVRQGKGQAVRTIELEKKGVQALKSWMKARPDVPHDVLFTNYQRSPLTVRGVRKIVEKYLQLAGIDRHITPHSFRHTFGTMKAEKGVNIWQLQQWLGHKNVRNTQIYVHMSNARSAKVMEATSL